MDIKWEDGFEISVAAHGGETIISANREGMVSLANILFDLAKGNPGDHIHLDGHNSLEAGSVELIIERTE